MSPAALLLPANKETLIKVLHPLAISSAECSLPVRLLFCLAYVGGQPVLAKTGCPWTHVDVWCASDAKFSEGLYTVARN
jgi:hypothetical protein